MHLKSSLTSALAAAALFVAGPVFAQSSAPAAKNGRLIRVTEKDAAWAAKQTATYPLDVCLTSDEKLGGMGKPADFIYRVEGQPDRLVRFCCAGCDEDFMKEPAKFLAKIDAAKNGKAKGDTKKSDGHKGHH